jgi:hypothetical protein
VTQAYDNSRSGAYLFETQLSPQTVAQQFGKLYERNVDGDVQAQPLYMRNVKLPDQSQKNMFFIATAKNMLYAFDADSTDTNPDHGLVWSRQIDSSRQLIVTPQAPGQPIEVCSETFNGRVGITSTPVIDPVSSTLYAVSWRAPLANLNLFTSSAAGAVQMTGWMGTGLGYHPWSALSPDSFVQPGQPITAVWSNSTHLDLFAVGTDGGIYSAWWEAEKGGQSWQWFRIGQPGMARPGQPVTAIWIGGQLNLFITGVDGTVKSTWWEAVPGWQNWFSIGAAGNAAPGEPVTAVLNGAHLDLFITAADGTVKSTWWEATPGWQNWFAIGAAGNATPSQPVTAVWSTPKHLDLFLTAADGTVKSTWWEAVPGWQSWFAIGAAGNAVPGQPVTALWSTPKHLDLFLTAADGTVKSTWWEAVPGWQSWFAIGAAGNATPPQAVTALWSTPTHLDLFLTATDGTVKSTWWEAVPGWQSWFAIGAAGSTTAGDPVSAVWAPAGHVTDIGGNYIHAIDLATGAERPFSPVKIQATVPGNPAAVLDPRCHRNRPALLLSNGVVYIGFSCLSCDTWCTASQPYRGWILGYKAANLTQAAVFTTAPTQAAAGIWQSGSGIAADSQGNIYFETGNGEPADPATAPPLGDSFVKLSPTNSSPGLAVAGSFQPANAQALRCGDTDLGSGGPALLPGGKLIGGGKEGTLYLLDAGTMSANQQFQAFSNTWHADSTQPPCPGPHPPLPCDPPFPADPLGAQSTISCYVDPSRYDQWQPFGPNIHGAPVVWSLPQLGYALIYKMPEKDFLKAFRYDLKTLQVSQTPALTAAVKPPDGMPGGFSSVSANGTQNGIVWTSFPDGDGTDQSVPGLFVAFDASTLNQIWEDDEPIAFAKFTSATIADGKVYRPTFANKVLVYGLLPTSSGAAPTAAVASSRARALPSASAPAAPATCQTISQEYERFGGRTGILGLPTGPQMKVGDAAGGEYQAFHGQAYGASVSVVGAPTAITGAQNNEDRPPFMAKTEIDASIYWSPSTCAHAVMGQILTLWLSRGAAKGALGYPTSDEIHTPDGRGRRNRFQHGEIWWYPDRGAFVH